MCSHRRQWCNNEPVVLFVHLFFLFPVTVATVDFNQLNPIIPWVQASVATSESFTLCLSLSLSLPCTMCVSVCLYVYLNWLDSFMSQVHKCKCGKEQSEASDEANHINLINNKGAGKRMKGESERGDLS